MNTFAGKITRGFIEEEGDWIYVNEGSEPALYITGFYTQEEIDKAEVDIFAKLFPNDRGCENKGR